MARYRRAFVVGAYVPNGGTHMAYHLGRILERDFGIPATAVTVANETPDHGIHAYDLRIPQISLAELERSIGADDILVVNPSFSSHQFGMRLPGFKLCYVQGFNTFSLLDLKFDHYVAVSSFVAQFLATVYALHARVIPAFVALERLAQASDWQQRPANMVLPYRKGLPEVWDASFAKLRALVAERAPEIAFAEPLQANGLPHREFLVRVGAVRHLLVLSAAEGFGLVPLEAMALGTLVCGYDGFGGRQFMRPDENCAVAPYPDIELVATRLIAAVRDPQRCEQMARHARNTAAQYSYAAFRAAWIEELRQALRIEPIG
jgi:hypothetical protein